MILFQLEVSLQEVGQDSQKKSALVNQIAESISKLNKAEDFTRQQDYIQRSSAFLKIDELGLTALVNKHIRERIAKEEKRTAREEPRTSPQQEDHTPEASETFLLVHGDEQHERTTVRALLEFGMKTWDDSLTVAEHMFQEIDENGISEMIDNKDLLLIIDAYRKLYEDGAEPGIKHFLYHENPKISGLAVSIMDTTHEISPRWKEFYEGPLPTREELYMNEVESSLNYLKLRKIKHMIIENQKDLEKHSGDDEMMVLLHTHQHLKQLEIDLTRAIGTVIIK